MQIKVIFKLIMAIPAHQQKSQRFSPLCLSLGVTYSETYD